MHGVEERPTVTVQLEAQLAGTQQLQKESDPLRSAALFRGGGEETLKQGIHESTQLQHGLHTVHLSAAKITPT